jgi:bifunctional non-homologous end joining protein LigD
MPTPKLDAYRAKRDPRRTPEPVPAAKRPARRRRDGRPGFVIQEHHARALHWDFRLERDGVLVSWALPKGLPLDPGQNHLAVRTEDHPLEYANFSGVIPAGEYGGGKVSIWDRGEYDTEKWTDGEVIVELHGTKARGRYALFSTARRAKDRASSPADPSGGRNWMIHRMDPPPDGWEPLPTLVRPMLCRAGPLPADDEGWAYELKWDGVRAIAYVEGGRVRLLSRTDRDITTTYPELRRLGEALGARPVVLDGEIVALGADGRPSFSELQQRIHVADSARAGRLAATVPVHLMVFDVLHLDGRSTLSLPFDERRRLLESLALTGSHWATAPSYTEVAGVDVARAAREGGLEGVVAKRRDSVYVPGRRSPAWIKAKHFLTQEVIIGGFTPGRGRRQGEIGALLLGIPGPEGLGYVGKVGSGFSDEALADLTRLLGRLRRSTSPFTGPLPAAQVAGATWVTPRLVGEVRYGERTADGRLRHPSWRGLRLDKDPADVVPER